MYQQGYEQNYGQVAGGYAGGPPQQGYSPGHASTGGPPPQGFQPGYAPAVGGPPSFQMGYDPSIAGPPPQRFDEAYPAQSSQGAPMMDPQSFALLQAQSELAGLEARKKEKEESRNEWQTQHNTKKLRSALRENADNQSCARTLCIWKVFNGLMYGLALVGDSWTVNSWHAMGIDSMTLNVGLFNMHVDLRCKDTIDMKFCNLMKKWADHDDGLWSIRDLRSQMCQQDKDACWTMDRLYFAGWIPLVLLPAAACFECISLLLLFSYWHAKPTHAMRSMSAKCAVAAIACAGVGFCGWLAVRPWISGIPRLWATMGGQRDAAAGVMFGLKENWCVPVGWCFAAAWIGALGNFVSMFLQMASARHVDEPDKYGLDESSALLEAHVRKELEDEKHYGAHA